MNYILIRKKILQKEKKEIDEDKLLELVMFCQNDIRKLISTLEYYFTKQNNDNKNFLDTLDKKNIDKSLFNSVFNILNEYKNLDEVINLYLSDKNLINLLIHENVLGIMKNYKNKDEDKLLIMEKIYENMFLSDIYDNQIYMNNNFELSLLNGVIKCGTVSYLINQQKNLHIKNFHQVI